MANSPRLTDGQDECYPEKTGYVEFVECRMTSVISYQNILYFNISDGSIHPLYIGKDTACLNMFSYYDIRSGRILNNLAKSMAFSLE